MTPGLTTTASVVFWRPCAPCDPFQVTQSTPALRLLARWGGPIADTISILSNKFAEPMRATVAVGDAVEAPSLASSTVRRTAWACGEIGRGSRTRGALFDVGARTKAIQSSNLRRVREQPRPMNASRNSPSKRKHSQRSSPTISWSRRSHRAVESWRTVGHIRIAISVDHVLAAFCWPPINDRLP